MATSVTDLLDIANAAVPRIAPAEARTLLAKGNVLLLDVRDAAELLKTGKIAGAKHVSRGMLEFRADPASPYHDKDFDPQRTVIVYCTEGWRSALSGKTLKDLGYARVFNLGGFKEWIDAGGEIERPIEPGM